MRTPPLRLSITVLTLAAAALMCFALAVSVTPLTLTVGHALLAVLLGALVALARLYPVHLAPKIKIGVATAPMFAVTLLLPAPAAMATVAVAVMAAAVAKPASWRQTTFTVAESVLRVGAGSAVFRLTSGMDALESLQPGAWLWAAPLTAIAMYAVNELLVDLVVGVQMRRSPLRNFWERRRFDMPQEGALFLLGLLIAGISMDYPWAAALLAVPSFVVYRSLRDGVALRAQTKEALEELADIVDMRDHYTFEHSRRVAVLARATAEALGLPPEQVEVIALAGRVHDVGKIGIKSTVLLSPSALSDPQWAEMRRHPEIGAQLVAKFPQFARGREIVFAHHERWDGTGYPLGLAGTEIPLGARVVAVCDAWDAMTSHRSYRKPMDVDAVYQEMERGRAAQFDPAVLDAFFKVLSSRPDLALPNPHPVQDIDGPFPHPSMA